MQKAEIFLISQRQRDASRFLPYASSSLAWRLRVHSGAVTFQVSPPESIHPLLANTEDTVQQKDCVRAWGWFTV